MTTPTPRTDAVAIPKNADPSDWVPADFARQLERELAAAQERIERLDACVNVEVPEGALKALGRWLAPVLDEDKWATAEKFLNAALLQLLEAQESRQRAEADAARYRWLRSKAKLEYMHPRSMEDSRMEWCFPKLFGMTCVMTEIPVDEAIDIAMKEKP